MRKGWFALVATVIVMAAGVYVCREHLRQHPQALVGRWGAWLLRWGQCPPPANQTSQSQEPPSAAPAAVGPTVAPSAAVPAAPTPVSPAAAAVPTPQNGAGDAEPAEIIKVEEAAGESRTSPPVAVAESPEPCEAEAATTVAEETPEPVPVGGRGPAASGTGSPAMRTPSPTAPWPHMPYADEESRTSLPAEPLAEWLSQFLRDLGLTPSCPPAPSGNPPAENTNPSPRRLTPDASEESEAPTEGITCPYLRSTLPQAPVRKQRSEPADEPGSRQGGTRPGNPQGLDTLEYRPSDGDEHAYDDLPL
jgi:hypothetical protein